MSFRQFDGADWVSIHAKAWLDWLGELIGKPNVKALELGTYEGRSACWWCENVLTGEGSQLACCDVWWQKDELYQRALLNLSGLPCDVIRTSTRRMLADMLVAGRVFDFIYVDADHHASSVLSDMCGAWHVLKPGGIMICDDYGWTNRKRAIPPATGVNAWLDCNRDKISGYEVAANQCAIWKPLA